MYKKSWHAEKTENTAFIYVTIAVMVRNQKY